MDTGQAPILVFFIRLFYIAGHNLKEDVLTDSFRTCTTS